MNSLLIYLIQASVSIAVFYVFYELLFRSEAYFKFIRFYFIFAVLISTILPLTQFSLADIIRSADEYPFTISPVHNLVTYTLAEVTIKPAEYTAINANDDGFMAVANLIFLIYFTGLIISFLIFLARIFNILLLLFKGKVIQNNNLRIVHIAGAPIFSFFNIVFMDKNKYLSEPDAENILAHESIHISQRHTIDIMLVEIMIIIQWFNPFVYLMRKRIKENHEFLADNYVIGKYSDAITYSLLLLENSTDIRANLLTHNFSYSLLKRRLNMIKQSKSPKLFAFKMIGVMIALSMVIYACSGPMEDQLTGNIKKVEPVNVNLKADSISVATFWNPKDTDIQFAVTLVEKSSTRLDVFDRNNQLVQTFMEGEFDKGSYLVTWSPEKNKKIPAGTYTYKLSVNDNHVDGNFTYGEALELPIPPKGEDVFTVVEEMPQFPGGNEALIDYLVKNVVYPKEAKDNNISGRVFVSFVVEKDGSIGDVKILRGIGGGCDEESVRVVSSMPKWIPGKQNGKPVRVAYNLPIKYALN